MSLDKFFTKGKKRKAPDKKKNVRKKDSDASASSDTVSASTDIKTTGDGISTVDSSQTRELNLGSIANPPVFVAGLEHK